MSSHHVCYLSPCIILVLKSISSVIIGCIDYPMGKQMIMICHDPNITNVGEWVEVVVAGCNFILLFFIFFILQF